MNRFTLTAFKSIEPKRSAIQNLLEHCFSLQRETVKKCWHRWAVRIEGKQSTWSTEMAEAGTSTLPSGRGYRKMALCFTQRILHQELHGVAAGIEVVSPERVPH